MATVPPHPPSPPPPAPPNPTDPAAQTQAILPRALLIWLAVAGFVLSVLLLLAGAVFSGHFADRAASFYLIVCAALTLSLFLWLLFPQDFQLTRIPGVDLTIKLAGPAALFFLTIYLLQLWHPGHPKTRYYEVRYDGSPPPADGILFEGAAAHPRLVPVVDRSSYVLTGLVARFDDPKPFTVEIRQDVANIRQAVTFTPGDDPDSVTLKPK
jgi:hypothetical protein